MTTRKPFHTWSDNYGLAICRFLPSVVPPLSNTSVEQVFLELPSVHPGLARSVFTESPLSVRVGHPRRRFHASAAADVVHVQCDVQTPPPNFHYSTTRNMIFVTKGCTYPIVHVVQLDKEISSVPFKEWAEGRVKYGSITPFMILRRARSEFLGGRRGLHVQFHWFAASRRRIHSLESLKIDVGRVYFTRVCLSRTRSSPSLTRSILKPCSRSIWSFVERATQTRAWAFRRDLPILPSDFSPLSIGEENIAGTSGQRSSVRSSIYQMLRFSAVPTFQISGTVRSCIPRF
jgi:hypothetical protein